MELSLNSRKVSVKLAQTFMETIMLYTHLTIIVISAIRK